MMQSSCHQYLSSSVCLYWNIRIAGNVSSMSRRLVISLIMSDSFVTAPGHDESGMSNQGDGYSERVYHRVSS